MVEVAHDRFPQKWAVRSIAVTGESPLELVESRRKTPAPPQVVHVNRCFRRKMNTIDCSPIGRNRLSSANSRKFTDADETFSASCAQDGPQGAWPEPGGFFERVEPHVLEHPRARHEEPDAQQNHGTL